MRARENTLVCHSLLCPLVTVPGLGWQPTSPRHSASASYSAEVGGLHRATSDFYVGAGHLNSGPHIYDASTLTHRANSSALTLTLLLPPPQCTIIPSYMVLGTEPHPQ